MSTFAFIRQVLLYPLCIVLGLAWAFMFYYQYLHGGCWVNRCAAGLGLAISFMATMATVSLWISRTGGFSDLTSGIFAVGVAAVPIALALGVFDCFYRHRRNGANNRRNNHGK